MTLPSELWGIVLAYGVDLGVRDVTLRPDPQLWLLCQSINGAFDDLYVDWIEPLLRRRVLVLPAARRSKSLYGQKRITLALGRSPPERLQLIERIQGDFFPGLGARIPRSLMLHQSTAGPSPNYTDIFLGEMFLQKCCALKQIKGGFCRGFFQLRTLDLENLPLQRIGHEFLVWSMVQHLRLPSELQFIGDSFLAESRGLKVLDLSHTKVRSIGRRCGESSHLEEVIPSPLLEVIGRNFLAQCSKLRQVDFLDTKISSLPDYFCRWSSVSEVRLPLSLTSIGDSVLCHTSAPFHLDLSGISGLTLIGSSFLHHSKCVGVALPPSIQRLGAGALADSSVTTLDLSACTQLITLQSNLGLGSMIEDITFPPTVTHIGDGCFGSQQHSVALCRVEFFGEFSSLRSIGARFFNRVTLLQELRLPPLLESLGDFGFAECCISIVDLSNTRISSLRAFFGEGSCFELLLLPTALDSIGARFLRLRKPLPVLDLSRTRLKRTNTGFAESSIETLLLPPTITSLRNLSLNECRGLRNLDASRCTVVTNVEEKLFSHSENIERVILPASVNSIGALVFAFTSCLRTLDLSRCTALEAIGDGFCKSSRIRAVQFPSSLKVIGREFLADCRELGDVLDLSHTKVSCEGVQPTFVKGSTVNELILPPSFFTRCCADSRRAETTASTASDASSSATFFDPASEWEVKFIREEAVVFCRVAMSHR